MDRRICLAALAVPFFVHAAANAADPVLVDSFNNGVVENTDAIPNFWTPRLSGSLGAATESAGSVRLNAGGSQYPHAQIASGVNTSFNFFRAPLVIEGSGLNFTSSTNSLNKAIFRLALSSRQLFDTAPTPPAPAGADDSEYWADDALALRIESGNNTPGQYQVALGVKENYPQHNTEYDGFQLFNPGNNSGATQSGPIRSFRLTYSAKFWDLKLVHDASPTNTTQVTSQFTGGVDQFLANWHDPSDAGAVTGNSSVILQTQLNNAAGTEQAAAALDQFTVSQLRQSWQGASGANWSDAANWSDGTIFHQNGDGAISSVPNFVGANVKFVNASAPTIVTTDQDETVGAMLFDSAQSFTIQPGGLGTGTLQMDTRWFNNEISVVQGSHTVVSPINLYKNLVVDASTAAAKVTLAGQVFDTSAIGTIGLQKTGPGTLEMTNVRLYSVAVDAGTLKLTRNAAANNALGGSTVFALSIAGTPAAPTATLDLTNNALVFDYDGSSPIANIRQLLRSGQTNGKGIITTGGPAGERVGYAEGSAFPPGGSSFAGQNFDGSSIVLVATLAGDANLDRSVTIQDFARLASAFNTAGVWTQGDFNYDGTVNISDFALLAANFNQTLAGDSPRAAVPEPATGLVLAAGAALVVGRRRRVSIA